MPAKLPANLQTCHVFQVEVAWFTGAVENVDMTTLLYCLVLYEKYESQLDFLFPIYIIYLKNIYKWKIKLMFQTTEQFSNGSAHLRQAYVPIPGLRWVGLQFPMISSSRYDVMFQSYVTNKQKGRLYIYKNICIYKYMWLYMRVYIYMIYVCAWASSFSDMFQTYPNFIRSQEFQKY